MIVEVTILDVSTRGVQVCLGEDDRPFWLPRAAPGVEWGSPPEPGEFVNVRIPTWLCAKHQQLQALRYQRSLSFQKPPGFDPGKTKEAFPMTDYPDDVGKGFLARNDRREKPSQPEFTGKLSIHGTEYRLAAWVREKDGKKFFSIAAREVTEQPSKPKPAATSQAFDDDTIPF